MTKYRPKHLLEYVAVVTVGFFISHAPYRVALGIGWGVAWLLHHVVRYQRSTTYGRIREVFPDADGKRVRQIAWLAWRDLVFNVVDMFRLHKIDLAWIDKHVENWQEVRDAVQAHCKTGQGAIVVSPHMGAVEIAAVCLQRFETPIFLISKRQKNQLTDKLLHKLRAATGISYIQVGSSLLKSVIRKLREGGVLTFLVDIRVRKGGIMVDFLGKQASVAPGASMFAHRTNVPIFPFLIRRKGWTRHRIEIFPGIFPDPDVPRAEDQQRVTQEIFKFIEKAILESPEQWFWYNRSWILKPVPQQEEN